MIPTKTIPIILLVLFSTVLVTNAQNDVTIPANNNENNENKHIPQWPPASNHHATVRDLHNEYNKIFLRGNRNAASHRWATFLLDRSSQMTSDRLAMFFTGFCAVSGSPIRPSDYNRYRLTLPKVGGGQSTGYMHYCCWPCVCDTQDYIRVDTKNVTLLANNNGDDDGGGDDGAAVVVRQRPFQFAVIGNPCDDPSRLDVPFVQPFDRRVTSIADSAREVRCTEDGALEGATLSDGGYIIIGMFFDSEDAIAHGIDGVALGATDRGLLFGDPTPGRMSTVIHVDESGRRQYQDEREYSRECEQRARNGYNSGMGEIFRKVCDISPISDRALGLDDCGGAGGPTCELAMDKQ